MSFVDFMIIGAMKSGTTTLAQILSMHPEVCFCQEKEPHYFSKSSDWQKGLEEYKNLYHPTSNQICGEASTTYTCYPEFNKDVWQVLYDFNPKLKFIYIMRDPVERIVSHYMHNYLRGYTSEPFEKVIFNKSTYINRTRYFLQIKPYIDLFGEEQVLLLTFKEFISNKKIILGKIANFLDIDASKYCDFDDIHANKSVGSSKRNVKIEKLAKNSLIKTIKPLFPKSIIKMTNDILYGLTKRKLDVKPNVSEAIEKAIYDLLILDVLEIEKLIGREITEWENFNKYINQYRTSVSRAL